MSRTLRHQLILLLAGGILPFLSPAEDAAPPVSIVFYNIRNYLAMERRVEGEIVADAGKPAEEIEALVAALVDIGPDILGVCEIGDAKYLEDLQTRLKNQGVDLPHTLSIKDASGYNRNLALLSRYPIAADHSRADYTYTLEGTKLPFQRGILDATIAISPTYHLRYIGLHLKSKREVPEGEESLMRLNEARLAREHIDRILSREPGANLIVMGDFNDLRIEPPIKTLQGNYGSPGYLTALPLKDDMGFTWTHYWSYADAYSRFDYTLYSKGLAGELLRDQSKIYHWPDWEKASDHRPLLVRIDPVDQ
jgi:endonuclease/exonuclease/phosphatase family metal-dependent hydrolase